MRRDDVVAGTLAVALALAGCQSGPLQGMHNPFAREDLSTLTPAERELREDRKRFNDTVFAGVLTGAVGGAAVGAVAALATGGDSKRVRNAAVGGAVIGGLALGVDGYVTAKREQAQRDNIRATQAAAADVQQGNAQLRSYLETSNRVLAEGKARLARLRADVAAKRVSADAAQAARDREQRNLDSMKETLAEAKKARGEYAEASGKIIDSPDGKRNLDAEIQRMNQQIGQLEANVNEYGRALSVSRG